MYCLTSRRLGSAAFAAALLLSPSFLPAADIIGRYGGDFMAAGGGARSLALGGAYTSFSGDAWSLFWNPAGLADIRQREAAVMHSERFAGVVDYDVASLAIPQPDGSVPAIGLLRLGVNGIPFTRLEYPDQPLSDRNRVEVDKVVSSGDYALFVGKGEHYKRWRWGVAPKLIFRHVGSDLRAYGLGLDAGVGGRPIETLPIEAGIAARDLFSTVLAWEQTGRKELIPSTVRLGLSGRLNLPMLEAALTPAVDFSYRFENLGGSDAAALQIGAEYLIRNTFALRLGSDDGRMTFGGGLDLKPMSLDYAFIGHDELGDKHRISITARWGGESVR
jgi:hypothetical protein